MVLCRSLYLAPLHVGLHQFVTDAPALCNSRSSVSALRIQSTIHPIPHHAQVYHQSIYHIPKWQPLWCSLGFLPYPFLDLKFQKIFSLERGNKG